MRLRVRRLSASMGLAVFALKPWAGAAVAALLLAGTGVDRPAAQAPAGTPRERVSFNHQIRPLLSDRCFRCHGPDEKARKAKMRLDTPEGAHRALDDYWFVIKPGDPAKSALVERIHHDDPDEMMPPPESHLTLSADERRLLVRWIEQGAEYQPHWAFVPVACGRVAGAARRRAGQPDRRVRARAAGTGAPRAPAPAEPAVLLRRLAFDLTGLPPTPAELDAFLADTVARRLRARRRSAARLAGLRRADGDGLARPRALRRHVRLPGRRRRDMSPWRDWVIRAFNAQPALRPVHHLAARRRPAAGRDRRAAAGDRVQPPAPADERGRQHRGGVPPASTSADRVHTFGTAFLGLTLECARCHDHKFDPITQRDYYALGAFFNSIDESGLYSHFTNATPTPALPLWPAGRREQHAAAAGADRARSKRGCARIARDGTSRLAAWRRTARVTRPAPVAHLDFAASRRPHRPATRTARRASPIG